MRNALLLSGLLLLNFAQAWSQDIDILSGVKIRLRDGVRLNATVYKPHDQKQSLPAIFTLTPYISDTYHPRGTYFARHGYVYVIVDVRGRGSSEGTFDPFVQEAKDGYDIVEWLAVQEYCNGKVTMWGGSYAGYDQWATAKELPPHLKTIVPVAAAKPGVDFPMTYNIGYCYTIQWLTFTNEKTGNENLFGDDKFWTSKYTERYNKDIPFKRLDSLAGNPSKTFQEWVSHPLVDPYIKNMCPTEQQYSRINFPILTITGDYDADQPGALNYYREFMQYASSAAKADHYLIIGPWDHPGTRTPRKEVGGLTFGDACLLDMNDLHRQWYDYTMKDSAKPAFLKNKVAYYISNKDVWKYVDSLGAIGREKKLFYLRSGGRVENDVLHSASLSENRPGDRVLVGTPIAATYIYDPLDKRFAILAGKLSGDYLTDQTAVYFQRNDGVIYHTAPFEKETEVSGVFALDAYIQADTKDVDIEAMIYEIKADGTSVFLTSDAIRARYRESLEKEKLLKPGEVNLYHFSRFTFISRVIEKGSRLRLVLTSPNSVSGQKNYGSGGIVADETAKDAHVAHISIYCDMERPSVLMVPVMP
jgi:putative CocE/NonD family hydrolase